MPSLTNSDVLPAVQPYVFEQDYSAQPKIDGVKIVELRTFADDGGFFMELNRWKEHVMTDFPDFELAQMNYSEMDPGVVKAWHLHYHQEDVWFVPPSHKLLINLHDVRADSATKDVNMRLVFGVGKARLLYIPRGVAHGAANLWHNPAAIIYFVNNPFSPDPTTTDEHRLPWDQFGSDIWQLTKG